MMSASIGIPAAMTHHDIVTTQEGFMAEDDMGATDDYARETNDDEEFAKERARADAEAARRRAEEEASGASVRDHVQEEQPGPSGENGLSEPGERLLTSVMFSSWAIGPTLVQSRFAEQCREETTIPADAARAWLGLCVHAWCLSAKDYVSVLQADACSNRSCHDAEASKQHSSLPGVSTETMQNTPECPKLLQSSL